MRGTVLGQSKAQSSLVFCFPQQPEVDAQERV